MGKIAVDDYIRAKKLGDRCSHQHLQEGSSPYLPVLDDLLTDTPIETRVSLGLVQIPLEQVVGTATAGRTSAFAANFMPLLDSDTEFAAKWAKLYDSMSTEGMREPILAVEYLGYFYIIEGNKRVSISKYLGGVSVEGTVTRYIPRRSDENQVYFEFLPFYHATKINYLLFSERGYYQQLALHVGYQPGESWSSQDRRDFHAAYLRFVQYYRARGGESQPIPAADALMLYLDVFGYDNLRNATLRELQENIGKLWSEYVARGADQSVALSMMPEPSPRRSLTSWLRPVPALIRAAFIYNSTADASGWVYAHELGRQHLQEVFGSRVQTIAREGVHPSEAEKVIRSLIADGYDVIFAASPVYLFSLGKLSLEFPQTKILNCSLLATYHHVRSYYLRMFEAKFIIGMLAGIVARDGRIGYVADYPIYGTPAAINAFTLGAQSVNPDAEIYLTWSCLKDEDPGDFMRRNRIDTISNRDLNAPTKGSRHFGLYQMDGSDPVNLAMPVWDWGRLYVSLINSILDGQWESAADNVQALNYWWGMSSGAIDVLLSRKLSAGTHKLVDALRESLQANSFSVFGGPIYDQSGALRSNTSGLMPPEDVISMDYLCKGVIGAFPKLEALKPEAEPVVSFSGIEYGVTPAELQFHLRQGRKLHETDAGGASI